MYFFYNFDNFYYRLAEGPGVARESNFELEKFCPGGCFSSGVARSGLAYSLNKREASDSNWSVGWNKHDFNWSVAPKNKHIYSPSPEIYK